MRLFLALVVLVVLVFLVVRLLLALAVRAWPVFPVLLLAVWAFPVRVLAPVCPVLGRQAPVSLASVDQVLRSKMLPAPVVRRAVLRRLMPTSIRSVPVAHLLRSAMSLTVLPARAVAARLLVSTSHSQRSPRLPSNLQFRRSRAARHP